MKEQAQGHIANESDWDLNPGLSDSKVHLFILHLPPIFLLGPTGSQCFPPFHPSPLPPSVSPSLPPFLPPSINELLLYPSHSAGWEYTPLALQD